jgi:6,7-dimethyl-8-ribityllumazine synthase
MPRTPATRAPLPDVAIVVSRYNHTVTGPLLDGAQAAFANAGGDPRRLTIVDAPGAYELPALASAAARTGRFAGVLALGCIIKGETRHDEYIAHAVAQGLVNISILTGVPCALGVLTVDTPQQALARAGGTHGNKGQEAMEALLSTIGQIAALAAPASRATIPSRPPGFARPDKLARAGRSTTRSSKARTQGQR